MNSLKISYKLWIHTLPKDLKEPLDPQYEYLLPTAKLYSELVNSSCVYSVWMIDEFGQHWIELDIHVLGRIETHTLKIDEGTFDKIECEESYEIEVE